MNEEKKDTKKGFAGLNSMTSKVDVSEPKQAESPDRVHQVQASEAKPKANSSKVDESFFTSVPKTNFWSQGWFKWIFGLGALALIINVINSENKPSNSSRPTFETAYEEIPAIGSGTVLSSNQIRYCLSEQIRLDSWGNGVNHYSDFSVDAFNRAVNDYNARCSNYRYKKNSLNSVRTEVESRRSQLSYEGMLKANLYR